MYEWEALTTHTLDDGCHWGKEHFGRCYYPYNIEDRAYYLSTKGYTSEQLDRFREVMERDRKVMHVVEKCRHGKVVRQCRCPGDKSVREVPCPSTCKEGQDEYESYTDSNNS